MIIGMLKPGISLEQKRSVSEKDVIRFLGPDVKPSLSSPSMIGWMEIACRDAVLAHLEKGQDTVGTRVNVAHLAATPLGSEVAYRAKLIDVDGRRLAFEVEARDGDEIVGQGTHERFIIDVERFATGLKKKFTERP